jgi:hypothetical protein
VKFPLVMPWSMVPEVRECLTTFHIGRKGSLLMERTYRAAAAMALALATLGPVTAAHAAPEDDAAELSQTIEVAWLMPGPYQGWATWPQTYLPDGVPACGEGAVQIDVYKYGTAEMRTRVAALVGTGVLTSPADDSRIATGQYRFVELEPCDPLSPGDSPDPGPPASPGGPVDPSDPGDPRDRATPTVAPRAVPARAHLAQPTYAG